MRITQVLLVSAAFNVVSLSAASAADVTYGDPSPPYAPPSYDSVGISDWTGAYVGAFGGAATGDFEYEATEDGADEIGGEVSGGGLLGGVQAGYDFQVGNVVLGGVADIAATDIDAEVEASRSDGVSDVSASTSSQLKYLGTVRGRAGYALDPVMVYGHGGLAYGKTELEYSESERVGSRTETHTESSSSDMKYGYVVGAGVEYRATDRISLQTEYGFHDLGEDEIEKGGGLRVKEDVDFHAVKAGVNFRF